MIDVQYKILLICLQASQLHQVVPRTSVFHCHKSRVKV
jgi:hypothetical protein